MADPELAQNRVWLHYERPKRCSEAILELADHVAGYVSQPGDDRPLADRGREVRPVGPMGAIDPTHLPYVRDCFPRALHFVIDWFAVDGIRLVHGSIGRGPDLMKHAWVEIPQIMVGGGIRDVIFDGVTARFYEAQSYAEAAVAIPHTKYTADQAMLRLCQTGNWHAPWEDYRAGET